MSSLSPYEGTIIGRKYKILNKIGSGSFSVVYKGENIRTKEVVAIKIEAVTSKSHLLKNEAKVCRYLHHSTGITSVKWYGVDDNNIYVVFDLLGVSLDTYMERLGKFSLKTTLLLGIQMIERLKTLHDVGILHRDIKPENFMMGRIDTSLLYIIDFGLSKLYLKNDEHIECKEGKKMTGTVRYISINIHNGLEPSRRDDLISLGYILIYFLKGRLPWQGLHALTREDKYSKIKNVKKHTSVDDLCEGLPKEFKYYLNYCYDLDFTNTPNYDILTTYLIDMYTNLYSNSSKTLYDWDISSNESIMEVNLESL